MHIDEIRAILRKRLKREPTFDDIADAVNGMGYIRMKEEIEKEKLANDRTIRLETRKR